MKIDKEVRENCKKNGTWELFYPDGTSSLMNYNPIEKAESELKQWKKKLKEWHYIVNEGIVNGLSHTARDGRLEDINFWRQRSILWNEFAICVQDLITEQSYKSSEKNLKEYAKKGYQK